MDILHILNVAKARKLDRRKSHSFVFRREKLSSKVS